MRRRPYQFSLFLSLSRACSVRFLFLFFLRCPGTVPIRHGGFRAVNVRPIPELCAGGRGVMLVAQYSASTDWDLIYRIVLQ